MNPFDRRLWAAAWYLLAYLVTGGVLFCVVVTAATAAAALAITLAGLPLLVALAAVIKGCANAERARTGRFLGEPIAGSYRAVTGKGILAQVGTRWKDPATWRDLAYLGGLYAPLFVLDTVVLTVWLVLLAGITTPAWYWAPRQTLDNGTVVHGVQLGYFPNGPNGHPGYGLYVDSLPRALLTALVCLILFLLFSPVLRLTAGAHANVARMLLRAPSDPLAEAKEVLSRPGPLTSSQTPRP